MSESGCSAGPVDAIVSDLDGAIKHATEVAEREGCTECGQQHRQLAAWLKELQDAKVLLPLYREIAMSKKYKRTTELNENRSPSTGSCTAFYGKSPWKGFKSPYMFFEVADCSGKIRLHNSQIDSRKSFIEKMKRLRNELDRFIDFLDDV